MAGCDDGFAAGSEDGAAIAVRGRRGLHNMDQRLVSAMLGKRHAGYWFTQGFSVEVKSGRGGDWQCECEAEKQISVAELFSTDWQEEWLEVVYEIGKLMVMFDAARFMDGIYYPCNLWKFCNSIDGLRTCFEKLRDAGTADAADAQHCL